MRYIKIDTPPFYKKVIEDVIAKYPNAAKIEFGFYEDLIFVISQGYGAMWRHMVTVEDLIKEVTRAYLDGKIVNMRKYEAELFTLRMDLIDFADSEFARALKDDPFLKLEEKFELVVIIMDAMVASSQTPQSAKKEMSDSAEIQGVEQQGGGGMAMASKFFKGFSFMMSHLFDMADSSFHQKNGGGKGYTRGGSAAELLYKESLNNKIRISELVDKFWNEKYMEMFEIARNIEFTFSYSRKGKLMNVEHIASNATVSKMKRMKDINRAVKMEIALDDVLDRKVMNHDVKVINYKERKEQKQMLYALLDCSGSTDKSYQKLGLDRIGFIKAVAIALGKKAIQDGSMFHFRWFDHGVRDMYTLKEKAQWGNFLTHILNMAQAGTNIDLAMHVASEDIEKEIGETDKSDMIVITDGTADIYELEKFYNLRNKGMKFHFILLENPEIPEGDESRMQKLAETFQIVDLDKVESLVDYKPEFRKVV